MLTLPIISLMLGLAITSHHEPLRYLALGDSYTFGEGLPKDQTFPYQFARRLREKGFSLSDPTVIARTGWTTAELADGIAGANLKGKFDLVTLAIGVNNQYRGLPISDYRKEFKALLDQTIAFAGGNVKHVIVVSIPDWGVTPFAKGRDRGLIGEQVNAFNAQAQVYCQEKSVAFVNVTSISKLAATEPSMVAGDSLHPSAAQYERWVELLLPHVIGALKK